MGEVLKGPRWELTQQDEAYPCALKNIRNPPKRLYGIGDTTALIEGLAVVGARKATPYGLGCARRFAGIAADRGVCIISGGARGCDAASHEAALAQGGKTVSILGSGCDELYPAENRNLFQQIIDGGGAVVSEQPWSMQPRRWMFRERNRLIAGIAKATLIVEAGLPSGTFSTADEAIAANRDVWVVPGAITSAHSHGANRLIYQGACPIVDEETFCDQLNATFDTFESQLSFPLFEDDACITESIPALMDAVRAQPLTLEEMRAIVAKTIGEKRALKTTMILIAQEQAAQRLTRYPDGRYGPIVKQKFEIVPDLRRNTFDTKGTTAPAALMPTSSA